MNCKSMIILILTVFVLMSIAGASASDVNDTIIASDDTEEIELSQTDNLETTEEDMQLTQANNDEVVSAENDLDTLGTNPGNYSGLVSEICSGGPYITLQHDYYTYDYGSTINITTANSVIDGNGAVIDMAGSNIRAFNVSASGVIIKNLTIKNANYTSGSGGAILFTSQGTIENCNFTNNAASYGGAISFSSDNGKITNFKFTGNKAIEDRGWGGAVYFDGNGTVTNCNFANNHVECEGGAVCFKGNGTVTNCNFTNNHAEFEGGAVCFMGNGTVTNCNFANNSARDGGAVCFWNSGTLTNCNFTNNTLTYYGEGGAVFFWSSGTVVNCNFIANKANYNNTFGGAIRMGSGDVTNCNFVNNSGFYGGAINMGSGNVTNCNFTDNQALKEGGAVNFIRYGIVTNCNFMGNNAPEGSAIYFDNGFNYIPVYRIDPYDGTTYLDWEIIIIRSTVSNSIFLNNRADAEELHVIKNDNNITIIFTGKDNLLNAMYSKDDFEVNIINVTYWSENGIANTGSSAINVSRSNREAGQNITVGVVVNGKLVLNEVKTTDDNGMIVLDIRSGENYFIGVRHDTDSYYSEAEKTISGNTEFSVNVTSQTTNNRTVNITAKSNIYKEFMLGKLLFIVPNSNPINATYAGNGTWWAMHTFDDYTVYEVNATYNGLDNVTINNATITISTNKSTLTVGNIVFYYNSSGSTTVSFTWAVGVNASVAGQPNAKVSVDGNTITVSGLNAGKYTLTVTTITDVDYNQVTRNVTITVNRLKTQLTAKEITATYNVSKKLAITLKDANGKPLSGVKVTVKIKSSKTYTTDKNGQIMVSTNGLAPKKYTAKITFNGNRNYLKSTKSIKLTVKKATPKLTAKNKNFKKSVKVKKYSVVLKYNKGKAIKKATVSIKVSKKTFKAKTNSKGMATFKIKKLTKKGTYNAIVTFKGDKYYNKATKKVKITIK